MTKAIRSTYHRVASVFASAAFIVLLASCQDTVNIPDGTPE